MSLVNLASIKSLLDATGTPHRIVIMDLWGELEFCQGSNPASWPPSPKPGEKLLALGNDVNGQPVAVFICE